MGYLSYFFHCGCVACSAFREQVGQDYDRIQRINNAKGRRVRYRFILTVDPASTSVCVPVGVALILA